MFFIPCIVDNQFTTVIQQKAQKHALDVYNITLNVAICFSPQVIIIRESNQSSTYKTKLVKYVNCINLVNLVSYVTAWV